ncbi:DUF1707 domain-containing protein [Actinocorallia longicatena]|uniref:DUF1707 domain-containing protein n=1 Tax=Actinocorallia longicatena TaxID=111803 RepID=A0ABP6Q3U6_9ACTN
MPQNPDMRASDKDRDRFAEVLRDNYAVGRLTQDELNERLEAVYAAKTVGGLQQLTSDLPEQDLHDLPIPASTAKPVPRTGSKAVKVYRTGLAASWAAWGSVNIVTFVVWLCVLIGTAGDAAYPWFLWVAGPWGAVLLAATLFGPDKD